MNRLIGFKDTLPFEFPDLKRNGEEVWCGKNQYQRHLLLSWIKSDVFLFNRGGTESGCDVWLWDFIQ